MAKSTISSQPLTLAASKRAANFNYRISMAKLKRVHREEWE
jgi:hypothetical protein